MCLALTNVRPPHTPVGCRADAECLGSEACRNGVCVDVCRVDDPCVVSAECFGEDHEARCRCPQGMVGDPYTDRCRPKTCDNDDDCPMEHMCLDGQCKAACDQVTCGRNAQCKPQDHRPLCFCPIGTSGNPSVLCLPSEQPLVPSCSADVDCPGGQACVDQQCTGLCALVRCGQFAQCRVVESSRADTPYRTAVCECLPGYVGDANTQCRESKTHH